ncbi:hypothetical protein HPP92_006184 [Vanilla planifolia]|uniref:Uncharacterized protein n=1 Tax=Vanilla planifolia TaxID=51239 RepID=A0A835RIJ7_VANPL|nr:hypothetical protein HPP92_006184 [Vanilla planifolia]
MPPSPVLRRSLSEHGTEKCLMGRGFANVLASKASDDDLVLFNEMQHREREKFLLHTVDDFEDSLSNLRRLSDSKLSIRIPTSEESNDLLNDEGEKNVYDWLLSPPDSPLFQSLDDNGPQTFNHASRGRPRSQPVMISRTITDMSYQTSRTSSSSHSLSPSPRSSRTSIKMRGRTSLAPQCSPPLVIHPTTPNRRSCTPSNKPSSPSLRTSTPALRRMSTNSSIQMPNYGRRRAPPLRKSISPISSRSTICCSCHQERDQLNSSCKCYIISSSGNNEETLNSARLRISRSPPAVQAGALANKKVTSFTRKTFTASSKLDLKGSRGSAVKQTGQRKAAQNMFRPLLLSVPTTTFHHNLTRNSSLTTSSTASSQHGVMTVVPEAEGSQFEHNDQSAGRQWIKDCDPHEEVLLFDKVNETIEDPGHEVVPKTYKNPVEMDAIVLINKKDSEYAQNPDVRNVDTTSCETLQSAHCADKYGSVGCETLPVCSKCGKELDMLDVNGDKNMNVVDDSSGIFDRLLNGGVHKFHEKNDCKVMFCQHDRNTKLGVECLSSISSAKLLEQRETELSDHVGGKKDMDIIQDCRSSTFQPLKDVSPSIEVGLQQGIYNSVLQLQRSGSRKCPVFEGKALSSADTLCSEPIHSRDTTNASRRNLGRGGGSASSLIDLGTTKQGETYVEAGWKSQAGNISIDFDCNAQNIFSSTDASITCFEFKNCEDECEELRSSTYCLERETAVVSKGHIGSFDQSDVNVSPISSNFGIDENHISENSYNNRTRSTSELEIPNHQENKVSPCCLAAQIIYDCNGRNMEETIEIIGCSEMERINLLGDQSAKNERLHAATNCSSAVVIDTKDTCIAPEDRQTAYFPLHNPAYPQGSDEYSPHTFKKDISFSTLEKVTVVNGHRNAGESSVEASRSSRSKRPVLHGTLSAANILCSEASRSGDTINASIRSLGQNNGALASSSVNLRSSRLTKTHVQQQATQKSKAGNVTNNNDCNTQSMSSSNDASINCLESKNHKDECMEIRSSRYCLGYDSLRETALDSNVGCFDQSDMTASPTSSTVGIGENHISENSYNYRTTSTSEFKIPDPQENNELPCFSVAQVIYDNESTLSTHADEGIQNRDNNGRNMEGTIEISGCSEMERGSLLVEQNEILDAATNCSSVGCNTFEDSQTECLPLRNQAYSEDSQTSHKDFLLSTFESITAVNGQINSGDESSAEASRSSCSKRPVFHGSLSAANILCSEPSRSGDTTNASIRSFVPSNGGSSRLAKAHVRQQVSRKSKAGNVMNNIDCNTRSMSPSNDASINCLKSKNLKDECKEIQSSRYRLGYDSLRETALVSKGHGCFDQSDMNDSLTSPKLGIGENHTSENSYDYGTTISTSEHKIVDHQENNELPCFSVAQIIYDNESTLFIHPDEGIPNRDNNGRNVEGTIEISGCSEMEQNSLLVEQNVILDAATNCSSVACITFEDFQTSSLPLRNEAYPKDSNVYSPSQTSRKDIYLSTSESIMAVNGQRNSGESSILVECSSGCNSRSLTPEGAIIHETSYKAATFGMEKEELLHQAQTLPIASNLSEPIPEPMDPRKLGNLQSKKLQKFEQRRLKGPTKPPKLECKCNCAVL